MKKNMRKLMLLALMVVAVLSAKAQNKIYAKYADMKGIEYVCINKSMMGMCTSWIQGVSSIDANKVDKMLVISSSSPSAKKSIDDDIKKICNDKNYEELINSRDDDSKVSILFNGKSTPKEFVICSVENDESNIIVILGNFSKKDIDKMMSK